MHKPDVILLIYMLYKGSNWLIWGSAEGSNAYDLFLFQFVHHGHHLVDAVQHSEGVGAHHRLVPHVYYLPDEWGLWKSGLGYIPTISCGGKKQ